MTIGRLTIAALSFCWGAFACFGDGLSVTAGQDCTQVPSFYEGNYRLAEDIEFRGGLSFLRSVQQMAQPMLSPRLRKGATLDLKSLDDFKNNLQSSLSAASDERVHVSIVQIFLEHCSPANGAGGELHVSVQIFDSSPSLALFRRFESRQFEAA